MTESLIQRDSAAWLFFVRASFTLSLLSLSTGIAFLPADVWVRGHLAIGALFAVGSALTLAKTLRDDHEAQRLLRRLDEAKTSAFLHKHADAEVL